MISPLQGIFMSHLVRMQRPHLVLELGCYIGYSALWIAHALRAQQDPSCHIWSCERDHQAAKIAKTNIATAGYANSVTLLAQSADDVLLHWDPEKKLDMIFIDANKSAYKRYYDIILNRDLLTNNGQIIVDNVLFHGRVHSLHSSPSSSVKTNTSIKNPISAKLHDFNAHVAADNRTTQTLLPLFDGLLLIQKINR
ncbi:S-adenosyl-L-methionine-dependent methyltransferase [Coemansia spiralis]|nr:S-adenosyl-L-methionine-dependent methyltransferase [Coemansia spiralis]